MRFKDTKQYAAAQKWRKAHPEQLRAIVHASYHRRHPKARTLDQIKAEKAAKALRTEKPCKRCGVVKPMTEFTPNKTTTDGKQYQCKECIQKGAVARYHRDPQRAMGPVKRWQRDNRDKTRHVAQNRRVRKRKIVGAHTLAQWHALCCKFDNRCVRCGKSSKLTRDHIIPITHPDCTHDISNIQPLCYSCNSSKGNHHFADYRKSPFINKGQLPLLAED